MRISIFGFVLSITRRGSPAPKKLGRSDNGAATTPYNAIRWIRLNVFKMNQADFAAVAGVNQSTVSRWESGVSPHSPEVERIRTEAKKMGLDWSDRFLFEECEVAR